MVSARLPWTLMLLAAVRGEDMPDFADIADEEAREMQQTLLQVKTDIQKSRAAKLTTEHTSKSFQKSRAAKHLTREHTSKSFQKSQAGQFSHVTEGTCESNGLLLITSDAECEAAAAKLGHNITWGPWGGYPDVMAGCSVRDGGMLFFQDADVNCTEDEIPGSCSCAEAPNSCLCRNPPAPVLQFSMVTEGTCESNGLMLVTTEDDCLAAAAEHGHDITDGPWGGYPDVMAGCSVRDGLLFLQEEDVDCVEDEIPGSCSCAEAPNSCLCRNPPPTVLVTEGTCESNGLLMITTESDCREAAAQLGLSITEGPYGGYPDVIEGCSVRDGFLFLQDADVDCVEDEIPGSCYCKEAPNACLCQNPASPVLVTEGTCESNGLFMITAESDCRVAASQLGLNITEGPWGGYPDVVAGCSVRDGLLFLQDADVNCTEDTIPGSCSCAEAPNACLCRRR